MLNSTDEKLLEDKTSGNFLWTPEYYPKFHDDP